jgi:NAD(P)-dependent dehydrogenase (short-subunit alcohol dehydrogenase family)
MEKENRNVIIIGGTSNLGKALIVKVKELYNGKILSTSRKTHTFEKYKDDTNFRHLSNIDCTKQADIEKIKNEAVSFFNNEQFDIIHTIGAFWEHVPFSDIDMNKAKEMIDSHFVTFYGVCYNLIPLMIERGGGHIIAFSCNSVKYNYPQMAAFTSAKAAVETLVKCLANEYSENGIRVNAIALSSLKTAEVKKTKPYADYVNFMPVEEVADSVVKLNNHDFKYMNGNVISLFKHSKSFFEQGYLVRNRQK